MKPFIQLTIKDDLDSPIPSDFIYKNFGYRPHEIKSTLYSISGLSQFDAQLPYLLIFSCIANEKNMEAYPFLNLFNSILLSDTFLAKWPTFPNATQKRVFTVANHKFDNANVSKSTYECKTQDVPFNMSDIINSPTFMSPSYDTRCDINSLENNYQMIINWNFARPALTDKICSFVNLSRDDLIAEKNVRESMKNLANKANFNVYTRNIANQPVRDMCPNAGSKVWGGNQLDYAYCDGSYTSQDGFLKNLSASETSLDVDTGVKMGHYTNNVCVWKWHFNINEKQKYIDKNPCFPWSPLVNKLYFARSLGGSNLDFVFNGYYWFGKGERSFQTPYNYWVPDEENTGNTKSSYQVPDIMGNTKSSYYRATNVENTKSNYYYAPRLPTTVETVGSKTMIVSLSDKFGLDNDPGDGKWSCGNFGFNHGGGLASVALMSGPLNLMKNAYESNEADTLPKPNTYKLDESMLNYLASSCDINIQPQLVKTNDNAKNLFRFNFNKLLIYKALISKQVSLCIQAIIEGRDDLVCRQRFRSIFLIQGASNVYLKDYILYSGLIAGLMDVGSFYDNSIDCFAKCLSKLANEYNPYLTYLYDKDEKSLLLKDVVSYASARPTNVFIDTPNENYPLSNYLFTRTIEHPIFLSSAYGEEINVGCNNVYEEKLDLRELPKYLNFNKNMSPYEILTQKAEYQSEILAYKSFRIERDFFCRTLNFHPAFTQFKEGTDIISFFGFSNPNPNLQNQKIGLLIDGQIYQFGIVDTNCVSKMISQIDKIYDAFKAEINKIFKSKTFFRYYSLILQKFGLLYANRERDEVMKSANPIMNTYISGTYLSNQLNERSFSFGNLTFEQSYYFYKIKQNKESNDKLTRWCNDFNASFKNGKCIGVRLPTSFLECLNIVNLNEQLQTMEIQLSENESGTQSYSGKYKIVDTSIPENTLILGDNFIPVGIKSANSKILSKPQCMEKNFIPIPSPSFCITRLAFGSVPDDKFKETIGWELQKQTAVHYLKDLCPEILNTKGNELVAHEATLSLDNTKFSCIDLSTLKPTTEFNYSLETDKNNGLVLKFNINLNKKAIRYNFNVNPGLI